MPTNRKVIDFKIHNLTEEQFQELKEAGQIDPNAIYCTPDETVANFEEINKEIEALKDKGGIPLLSPMWADHTLNDMSWLNADTFSWQSGDVYVAAYEHLANEVVTESGTKKYIYVKMRSAAGGSYRDDSRRYYRAPECDYVGEYSEDKGGYTFAWRSDDGHLIATNTETPAESDTIQYYGLNDSIPDDPPGTTGLVREAGEGFISSNIETETVDGITITFYRADDGHKICLADQEANVQALYDATGIAWYYILDIENKQFKLPRTKWGFTGLRDSVGAYVGAGLPNIYGSFSNTTWLFNGQGASGAFTAAAFSNYAQGTVGSSTGSEVAFSASRSSSVYGNSNTVQPPATQMYLYFYVGNFEREAIEQTAGITSEQLNNKADVSDVVELQNNKLDKSAEIYLVPTGTVSAFAGSTPPTGWLKCDGSAISRTTYAKLFAAIGGLYGTGDGSTTFNLPNLQGGRTPVGMTGEYVGKSTNGVLPNITGSLFGAKGGSNPSGTGAIAVYPQSYEGTYGSGGGQYYNWDFNASRSNSMYGNGWFNGEKVIPASVGMTYCIKY